MLLPFFSTYAQKKITTLSASDLHKPGALNGTDFIITDNNLDKFIGTWAWKDGSKQLTFNFVKDVYHYGKGGHVLDLAILKADYLFTVNGKIVAKSEKEYPAIGTSIGRKDSIDLIVGNSTRTKSTFLLLAFMSDHSINVEVNNNVFEHSNDPKFELPTPITLTKKE